MFGSYIENALIEIGLIKKNTTLVLINNNERGAYIYTDNKVNPKYIIKVFNTKTYLSYEKEIIVWERLLSHRSNTFSPIFYLSCIDLENSYAYIIYSYCNMFRKSFAFNEDDTNTSIKIWHKIIDSFLKIDFELYKLKDLTNIDLIAKDYTYSIPININDFYKIFNEFDPLNNFKAIKTILIQNLDKIYNLPIGLIHGDASLRNLVKIQKNKLGFIDWECCSINTPVAELCQATNFFLEVQKKIKDQIIIYFISKYNQIYNQEMDYDRLSELIELSKIIYLIQKNKIFDNYYSKQSLTESEKRYLNYLKAISRSINLS